MEATNIFNAIGWTLIHSLWQGALIACIVYALLIIGRNVMSSANRYNLLSIGMTSVLIWSLHTFSLALTTKQDGDSVSSLTFSIGNFVPADPGVLSRLEYFLDSNVLYLVILWMAGLVFRTTQLASGMIGIRKLRKAVDFSDHLNDVLLKMKDFYGVRRSIQIGESVRSKTPMVLGFLRPIIILPLGYASSIPYEQLELVIAHELAHIKRNDYLLNLVLQILSALYFFNPFVHWMSNKIETERECACDDMVLKLKKPMQYARALLSTNDYNPSLTLKMSGHKNELGLRINRIMKRKIESKNSQVGAIVLLALLLASVVWAEKKNLVLEEVPVRTAAIWGEPTVVPVGPYLPLQLPYMDTVPDLKQREKDEFGIDMDIDRVVAIQLQMDAFVDAFEDIEIPEVIEMPPFPDFKFDTIIPMKTMERMQEAMERMEMINIQEVKDIETKEAFKEMMLQHEEMAKVLQQEVIQNLEEIDFEKYEAEYLKQIEGLEEVHEVMEIQMLELQEQLKMMPELKKELAKMESVLLEETKHIREFEYDMKEALVEDGYWQEGEELNIKFSDDWMEVNGERIEGKKFGKYRKLKEKHFPEDQELNYRFD